MTWSEKMLRHAVENSAAGRALKDVSVELPVVRAPSLEGLEVRVTSVPPITPAHIQVAVFDRLRAAAKRKSRSIHAQVQEGDELTVDIVAYCDRRLVPFTAIHGGKMILGLEQHLPGMDASLRGRKVSETVYVRVRMPPAHPVTGFRNRDFTYGVTIQAAQQLTLPAENDPKLLALDGCKTSEELSAKIVADVQTAVKLEVHRAVLRAALDQLIAQVIVPVPDALVDQVISREWMETESKVLASLNLPADDRDESLRAWLADSDLRKRTARGILEELMLRALAVRDHVKPSAKAEREYAADVAKAIGVPKAEVLAALKPKTGDPETRYSFERLTIIQHVLSKVKVRAA